ncbi:retroelement silencing factor 1 [Anomaloglossus baeobatrachus]|uniref:retroelement silencing factor 1 n=1 Tax=Anomaloglossus baeobatrachus TaxID=238106 RepID=UPI003F503C13
MSIKRMDWSRNANGAVAHPNNQQYLQQSTSSIASTMPSQTTHLPPNYCLSVQNPNYLKQLLSAQSSQEILQIQQSALSRRQMPSTPVQQTTQGSSMAQYNASYNLVQMANNVPNQQSSHNVQNPALQSFQVQTYPVAFLQTFQQAQSLPVVQQQAQSLPVVQQQTQSLPVVQQQAQSLPVVQQQAQSLPVVQQQAQSLPVVQQQAQSLPVVQQQAQSLPVVQQQAQSVQFYGANGYNSREVQQPMQGNQSRGYSHKGTSQQMDHSYFAKNHNRNTRRNYRTLAPHANAPPSYSIPNGNSNSSVVPYTATNDNVHFLTPNSQNAQNLQMGSNLQTVPLTNTLQPQGGMNDYVQSSQGQMMPGFASGFANNSSNVLPSASVGRLPPPYTQSNTNTSNVYVNQPNSNPNQTFGEQNVQQPYTASQDQHSVALPPLGHSGNVPQEQRQNNMRDILSLLKIYQNIKYNYILLNRENNLLRQKMQSAAQDNPGSSAVKPPLISTLPSEIVPTNNPKGVQEVSQNSTAQNQTPATHGVQSLTSYAISSNVPVQNITHPSNSFSSYVNPTHNADVLSQRNSTGFENGHMNLGANSSGQAVSSETIQGQDPQTSMVSTQANNQYFSSGNTNGNVSQDGLNISSFQNCAQTTSTSSESCNPVQTTNGSNPFGKRLLTSTSREAIKASLPLWKSVPSETEPKKNVVTSTQNALHFLEEMAAGVTLTQKPEHSGSNISKGIEPQIAIVPPLVQIKVLVNDVNQCPKVISQVEGVANNEVNGLKENDSLSNILLALDSVNVDAAKTNPDNIQPRSNVVSASPCKVDQNSTEIIELVDDDLQISGICTLVEGNSLYNSSIAMMFNGSPLIKTEAEDHHSVEGFLGDTNIYDISQANTASSTIETMDNNPEVKGEFEPIVNSSDDSQGTNVYCPEIQPGQDLTASNTNVYCPEIDPGKDVTVSDMFGLESNTVSDQLSELLTEFPFGIKNFVPEIKPKSIKVSLEKIREKHEIPKSSVPFSCDLMRDGSIEEPPTKYDMDTSTIEGSLTQYILGSSTHEESKNEYTMNGATDDKLKTEYDMDTATIEGSLTQYILGRSINEESKNEYTMDGATYDESKTEYIMNTLINQESKMEHTIDTSTKEIAPQKTEVKVKREPTPEVPIDEMTFDENDGFEVCESPDGSIQIILLNKDQMTEFFPDEDSPKPVVKDEESPVDHYEKIESPVVDAAAHYEKMNSPVVDAAAHYEKMNSPVVDAAAHYEKINSPVVDAAAHYEKINSPVVDAAAHLEKIESPVVDVAARSIKKEPDAVTTPSPEKQLFCCLFSWLNHTNGNAPKCNCKQKELEESEGWDICENNDELNTDPSADVLKPTTAGYESSVTDHCKSKFNEVKNSELLPPVKGSKLERIEVSSKGNSPQKKSELALSEKHLKENQSRKEPKHYDYTADQKILQPRSYIEDHNSKKVKDHFSGHKSKFDSPQKSEKLIVKTDFLKNKHLLKMKRKYKDKTSHVEQDGARPVPKINTEVGESAKSLIIDRIFGSKAKNEKSKSSSTTQQYGRSMNKIKSYGSSDKPYSRSQSSSVGKRKERIKSRGESRFEKEKRVPSVQEYLVRKREGCNNRFGSKVDQREESAGVRHRVVEKSSVETNENNSPPKLQRPISPLKINVKTKNLESENIRQAQKGQPKSSGTYESLHRKHRGPPSTHGNRSLVNKRHDQKISSGKEKIYLTPCDGTKLNSYEGISLTKLQIRCSPEKPGYFERRKSLDDYVQNKPSKSETKNEDAPKMLEFKLCPEFVNRSPSAQEKKGEPKQPKEKSVIEGIKSKKEAWCIGIPFKKRKINMDSEDQGHPSPPQETSSQSTQKPPSRPVQNSQTTFNVFKQLYHEQRSKSLDGSL